MTDEEMQTFHDSKLKQLQKELEEEQITEEEYYKFKDNFPRTKIVDEKFFNHTLWEMATVPQPLIFICQKN